MKQVRSIPAALMICATLAGNASAQTADETKFSFNLGITSDYIFRGFSQTARHPTGQAGADISRGIFYAGLWASGLDFGQDAGSIIAKAEVDIYAGVKPVWQGITFDIGGIYYAYPGAKDKAAVITGELDYFELKLGASRELWKGGTWTSTLYWSPDYTNSTGKVWTSESGFAQELPALHGITPTISALYGYQKGSDGRFLTVVGNGDNKYSYWNAGLTLGWEKFSLDLRYWDTNIKSNNAAAGFADNFCGGATAQCDSRFVATFKFTY